MLFSHEQTCIFRNFLYHNLISNLLFGSYLIEQNMNKFFEKGQIS